MRDIYLSETADNVVRWIEENYSKDEIKENLDRGYEWEEELYDKLWTEDSVTGNGSGSYTFSRTKAEEYVFSDVETVVDALKEFEIESETLAEHFFDQDWEWFDVTARCYILPQAISAAIVILDDEREVRE